MDIHLHIGLEKTGTTTLQQFLAGNRASLRARGILFPESPGEQNQTRLAAYALDPDSGDSVLRRHTAEQEHEAFRTVFRRAFVREARQSGCRQMLLSNEHCSSRLKSVADIRQLKTLLDRVGTVVGVVIYLRRQDDFLLSTYSTSIKTGAVARFAMPRERKIERRYDFAEILRNWAAVFGEAAMRPRIFAPEDFVEGDLLADFCEAMNIPRDGIVREDKRRNLSLSAEGLEMLRLLNAAVPREQRMGQEQRRLVKRIDDATRGPRLSLSPAARADFLRLFEDSNEEVRRRYFPHRPALFAPVDPAGEETPLPTLTLDRAMEITAALLREDGAEDGSPAPAHPRADRPERPRRTRDERRAAREATRP